MVSIRLHGANCLVKLDPPIIYLRGFNSTSDDVLCNILSSCLKAKNLSVIVHLFLALEHSNSVRVGLYQKVEPERPDRRYEKEGSNPRLHENC